MVLRLSTAQVAVTLPPSLKRVLLEGYKRVQAGQLAELPCKPTVADILAAFVEDAHADKSVAEPGEEVRASYSDQGI